MSFFLFRKVFVPDFTVGRPWWWHTSVPKTRENGHIDREQSHDQPFSSSIFLSLSLFLCLSLQASLLGLSQMREVSHFYCTVSHLLASFSGFASLESQYWVRFTLEFASLFESVRVFTWEQETQLVSLGVLRKHFPCVDAIFVIFKKSSRGSLSPQSILSYSANPSSTTHLYNLLYNLQVV